MRITSDGIRINAVVIGIVFVLMNVSGLMTKLIKAGVRELEVACGPCIGMGFAPPTKGASVFVAFSIQREA